MVNLPTETMEEILVKLPVKDLLRFKCVCKDWLNLITSRRFINRHYSHKSKQPCQLLRLYPDTEEQYFYCFYPMYDDNRRFLRFEEVNFHQHLPFCNHLISDLMGPVNGIFCIRFDSGDLALSNPAIRELRPLPPGTFDEFIDLDEYALGFGCDPSCGNLKLVELSVQNFLDTSPNSPCVYNFSTDSWKTIEIQIRYLRIRNSMVLHPAFVNGVYYWFVDYDDTNFGILAFDMRSEKFHQIMIPDYVGVSLSSGLELRIVGHGNSMALHLQKSSYCRHGFTRKNIDDTHGFTPNICVGEIWQLDGRSMALDLCTLLGRQKFVGELWVMKREGYWRRTRRVKAEWILPSQWVKMDKDDVVELTVGGDHIYKQSLVSIKREGEGEDAIQAFLYRYHF